MLSINGGVGEEESRSFLQGGEILFLNPSIKYYSLEAIRLASHFILITKMLLFLFIKFVHILIQIFKCFNSHAIFLCEAWSHIPVGVSGCFLVLFIPF